MNNLGRYFNISQQEYDGVSNNLGTFYPKEIYKKEGFEKYTNIIDKYRLHLFERELRIILDELTHNWRVTEISIQLSSLNPSKDLCQKDLKTLIDVIATGQLRTINRIEFLDHKRYEPITDKFIISELVNYIHKEALLAELNGLYDNRYDRQMSKPRYQKTKFMKSMIVPLFDYLKNVTPLNLESDNEIYRFIIDYCQIAGVNWSYYSSKQSDLFEYLKDTIIRIKKNK